MLTSVFRTLSKESIKKIYMRNDVFNILKNVTLNFPLQTSFYESSRLNIKYINIHLDSH